MKRKMSEQSNNKECGRRIKRKISEQNTDEEGTRREHKGDVETAKQVLLSAADNPSAMSDYFSKLVEDAPGEFFDPIFFTLMDDPVILSSGFVCDRKTIIDERKRSLNFMECPWTRERLQKEVYPVVFLRTKILNFKEMKIRPMLDAASSLIKNKKIEVYAKVQPSIKEFLSSIEKGPCVPCRRELIELDLAAWMKADELNKHLWDPSVLAERFVDLYNVTPELHWKVIHTPAKQNDSVINTGVDKYVLWDETLPCDSDITLTFDVKAKCDVRIGLFEERIMTKMYGVLFASGEGSVSKLWNYSFEGKSEAPNPRARICLDGEKFTSFWIRILKCDSGERVISAGSGTTPGFNIIVMGKMQELDVRYVGFSTGSSGVWTNIKQRSNNVTLPALSKKAIDFQGRISILEKRAREAISRNQLDAASKWCDACDIVNKSCRSLQKLLVNQIRLDIGKGGGEDLEYLRLCAYDEIRKDPKAVHKFCETEGINKHEYEKRFANMPVGISVNYDGFVNGATFTFANGRQESYCGIGGNRIFETKLDFGEMIVLVEGFQLKHRNYLGTYIKFTTNRGREILVSGDTSMKIDKKFSIPNGKEIHEIKKPAGYYYRFAEKEGIYGLRLNTGKIEGVINADECMAIKGLRDGEYNIINVKKGPLFCSDNFHHDGNIWPFVAPNQGYRNKSQESWHVLRQENGKYTIRNSRQGGLLINQGTRHGPVEADNDGTHFTWVCKKQSETCEKAQWNIVLQSDGTYKIFSVPLKGPLFCHNRLTMDGDHYPRTHNDPSYEDDTKERWKFNLISPSPIPAREDIFIKEHSFDENEQDDLVTLFADPDSDFEF